MAWPYPWQNIKDDLVFPPGALRDEIWIQSQPAAKDAYNAPAAGSWTKLLATLAFIATTSSKELYLANQFSGEVSHLVVIRWPGPIGIAAGMRVFLPASGQVFTIQAPPENVQQRNRRVNLLCLELTEPGAAT